MNSPSSPATRRCGWSATFAIGVFLLAATPARPESLFERLFPHDVNVITTTDVLASRLRDNPASPDHPVYYVAVSAGYRDFGRAIAGDKLPARQTMLRTIARVLAKAGYLPADTQHPASQLIAFAWGTLYPVTTIAPGMPDFQFNRAQMLQFLGGRKLGLLPKYPKDWTVGLIPGLSRFRPSAEKIADAASSYLYIVSLVAYHYPPRNPQHMKLLWRTRISCPSEGLVMSDTLPTMLAIAAPYIGHDTALPVWIDASKKFKPHIEIGNPKVEQYLDSVDAPWLDDRAAPTRAGKTN